MKQAAINYGQALFQSSVSREAVSCAEEIHRESRQLHQVLESPLIPQEDKEKVIEKVFPGEIWNFMKLVCRNNKAKYLSDIFLCYHGLAREADSVLKATLYYAVMPGEETIKQMKEYLCREYKARTAEMELVQDSSLLAGFMLQVGNIQYDCSTRGALARLRQRLVRR